MKKFIILILCLCALFFILVKGINPFTADKESREEQLEAKAPETYSNFYQKLVNGEVEKIKLVGDSITAGVGAQYLLMPDVNQVIFENQEEVYREAGFEANSWSNLFRNYINEFFPDVEFVNAGISGKSAKWANRHKERWVGDEDVVFVMLGTNDRWDSQNTLELKDNLTSFLEYVDANSEQMIVMSPPPALSDGQNERYHFGTEEINQVVKSICRAHGYQLISHYDAMTNYASSQGVALEKLLQTTGSHPIDAGYRVIWEHIKSELTLYDRNEL
ncbi:MULTISPECIES: SGNH/GDSL hydrolase family protein [Gracilibacillus]|uniref:SGNH/GDSL hydrolase family protein n=1 Tax=Gracilibacillus TaxID=74385 RepID=UPI00082718E4|nr:MULTISPECIES: SGNH/GDSL hydrolase family protein [Gracilibacillus]